MATLGELERVVMDELWSAPDGMPAKELLERINAAAATEGRKPLALTTVLTVLSRLESKHFVSSERGTRPRTFRARGTLADHTANLMAELLASSTDREAALARFVGSVPPGEAATLRRLLG
ncbi:BlaI/MecI/CopY family transcriptional regulator [Rathayibacter sp. YIM 133350]|uniref:BlaI/MecI/CopY family transcriptional regulator n=1 Tax=Rathayibacter sp. YIM 133350 TaxID=3131992 RepID=UPI00307F1BC8